jgi:hypothetical protein
LGTAAGCVFALPRRLAQHIIQRSIAIPQLSMSTNSYFELSDIQTSSELLTRDNVHFAAARRRDLAVVVDSGE